MSVSSAENKIVLLEFLKNGGHVNEGSAVVLGKISEELEINRNEVSSTSMECNREGLVGYSGFGTIFITPKGIQALNQASFI